MCAAIVVAGLAVLAISLLCVPLDLSLHLEVQQGSSVKMRLSWLFGLVHKDLRRPREKPEERKEEAPSRRERRRRPLSTAALLDILEIRGLFRRLFDLAGDILKKTTVSEMRVCFRAGLDDPCDTALLIGPAAAGAMLLSGTLDRPIELEPAFDEAVFEGRADFAARLRPIVVTAALARFAFSPVAARAVLILIRDRWKRRK